MTTPTPSPLSPALGSGHAGAPLLSLRAGPSCCTAGPATPPGTWPALACSARSTVPAARRAGRGRRDPQLLQVPLASGAVLPAAGRRPRGAAGQCVRRALQQGGRHSLSAGWGGELAGRSAIEVRLVDKDAPDAKPNLDFVLKDFAEAIVSWLAEGKSVLVHCVGGQRRTPAVAAAYLAERFGLGGAEAFERACAQLPGTLPNAAFLDALGRLWPRPRAGALGRPARSAGPGPPVAAMMVAVPARVFFLSKRDADDQGELVECSIAAYSDEAEFQRDLANHPKLLASLVASAAGNGDWLLVGREMSVPDHPGGSARWRLDHLFLDADGVPTFVEVKRASDTRIRREVVGQMLDYAANGLAYWPAEQLRAAAEETRGGAEKLAEKLQPLLAEAGAQDDIDGYFKRVAGNLAGGRARLVFVADEVPIELQRVVEFLNGSSARPRSWRWRSAGTATKTGISSRRGWLAPQQRPRAPRGRGTSPGSRGDHGRRQRRWAPTVRQAQKMGAWRRPRYLVCRAYGQV